MLKPPRKCTVLITSTLRCHQLPYGAISFPGRVWVPLTFEERNLQRRECPAPGAPNSTEDQRCQPKNPISQIQCISVDYGGPLIDFPPKKSTKQNLPGPPPQKKKAKIGYTSSRGLAHSWAIGKYPRLWIHQVPPILLETSNAESINFFLLSPISVFFCRNKLLIIFKAETCFRWVEVF